MLKIFILLSIVSLCCAKHITVGNGTSYHQTMIDICVDVSIISYTCPFTATITRNNILVAECSGLECNLFSRSYKCVQETHKLTIDFSNDCPNINLVVMDVTTDFCICIYCCFHCWIFHTCSINSIIHNG